MLYSVLTDLYSRMESTDKRLEMIDLLAGLFDGTPTQVVDKVAYLTKGELHPDWMGFPEIGMGEKMTSWTLAEAAGISREEALEAVKREGGVGPAAQNLLRGKVATTQPLTVTEVYARSG